MYNFIMILEILLPMPTEKTFFYKSKDKFRNIKIGTIVKVEFRNQITFGIIWLALAIYSIDGLIVHS